MEDKLKEIHWTDVDSIEPNPKNRKRHPKGQIERLVKLIEYQGFRHPLIVSSQTGLLVVGHCRLLAAKKMGLEKVPVMVQDFESIEQETAFAISDNAISEWGELDIAAINADLPDLGPDFEIENLGIFDFELDPADRQSNSDSLKMKVKFELGKIILTCSAVMPEDAIFLINSWCERTGEDAFKIEDDGSKTAWSHLRGR